MKKLKKIGFSVLAIMMIVSIFTANVSAAQIYTNPVTSEGCTGKGNLYATRINDYIRVTSAGTYVSGTGTVTARAWLYRDGSSNFWEGYVSGNAASGVTGNTSQLILSESDNAKWVRSEHHFKTPNGYWIQLHTGDGLSLLVWNI